MSGFSPRPISVTYGTKLEVTVTASAGTSQLIGQMTGPSQFRLVNFDTVRVAYIFGKKAATDAVTIAGNPSLPAGAIEVITVHPNEDGSAVYWNVISDASPTGNKFEVTRCQGI